MKFTICHTVNGEIQQVNNRFNQQLFLELKPALMNLEIVTYEGHTPGSRLHIRVGGMGMMQEWTGKIDAAKTGEKFIVFRDAGEKLPFPLHKWQHVHALKKLSQNQTLIIDRISFHCKNQLLTVLFYPFLYIMFRLRRKKYQKYFRLRTEI